MGAIITFLACIVKAGLLLLLFADNFKNLHLPILGFLLDGSLSIHEFSKVQLKGTNN